METITHETLRAEETTIAAVTDQTFRDLNEDIENLKSKISGLRERYEADVDARLEWYKSQGKPASDELIEESEKAMLAIKASEENLQRKEKERNLKTCVYYVEKYLSARGASAADKPDVDGDHASGAGRKKRGYPDDRAEFVAMATQLDRGAGVITREDDALFGIADADKIMKQFGFTWVSLSTEAKTALRETVALLTNHSITHCPKQMNRVPRTTPKNHHLVMDPLITSMHDLQDDTVALGGAVLAIIDSKMSDDTITDLVASLERTHDMHELRDIYAEQNDPIEAIVRSLGSSDVSVQKAIRLRLLHHVVVLTKYVCLGTGLAVALAPKFGRGQGGSEDNLRRSAIADKTLRRCVDYHGQLYQMYVTEIAEGPQLAEVPRTSIAYNMHDKVCGIFENSLINGRLVKLSQDNRDLRTFLGSVGDGQA
ncbi:hypothetical protein PG985_005284 [Apiospora marii]|uniref:Uncharacterized protein n=1 Tax=Apiospora marii TaxID=335849 RepID=A0ABR1SBQ2_9PEZI